MPVKIIMLSSSAVFSGGWIVVTDFLDYLPRTKIISNFILASYERVINACTSFGYFPGWLAIFEEPRPNSSDKAFLVHPFLLFFLYLLNSYLNLSVKAGRHTYLLKLHRLLNSVNLAPESFSMLDVLFLFFWLNSWPFRCPHYLIVHKFWVTIYYEQISLSLFCLLCSFLAGQDPEKDDH